MVGTAPRASLPAIAYYETGRYVAADVLNDARMGVLPPDWRERLRSNPQGRVIWRRDQPAEVEAAKAAAVAVSHTPPGLWEPGAARGDWRAAIRAWRYVLHAEVTLATRLHHHFWAFPKPQATRAVIAARERDSIDAAVLHALNLGGDTEIPWRAWYLKRVRETWSAADDAAFGLYPTRADALADLIGNRHAPAVHRAARHWPELPPSWTATQ